MGMGMVLAAMLGWLVAICLLMMLRGIVRQDEKAFKAGSLGMLSIIVGTLIGVLILYTKNVVTG